MQIYNSLPDVAAVENESAVEVYNFELVNLRCNK